MVALNIFVLLYMNAVKDPVILASLQHRLLTFIGIYNIFLSIFLVIAATLVNPYSSAST
jgi:hypothetical protein